MSLSNKEYKLFNENGFRTKEIKNLIKKLKKAKNAEGSTNCQCLSGKFIEGGKDYTCDFCKDLIKIVGKELSSGVEE